MKIIGQTLLILGCICMGLVIFDLVNNSRDAIATFVFAAYNIVTLLTGGFFVLIGSIFTVGGTIIEELRELRELREWDED